MRFIAVAKTAGTEAVEEQAQRIQKMRLENDKLEAQNLLHFMQALTSIGEK